MTFPQYNYLLTRAFLQSELQFQPDETFFICNVYHQFY